MHLKLSGRMHLINISAYAFGLSATLSASGFVIQQRKISEALENNPVIIAGYKLDEAGALGLVSFAGLAVAAVMQPLAGALSDRLGTGAVGRIPFIIVGAIGLGTASLSIGFAPTFAAIMLVVVIMQVFSSIQQGPANALIYDCANRSALGRASGVLNMLRIVGASSFTIIVLGLTANYNPENGRHWLWLALVFMTGILILSTLWTGYSLLKLRREKSNIHIKSSPNLREDNPSRFTHQKSLYGHPEPSEGHYILFLLSLSFILAALSAMGLYSLYFVENVLQIDKPEVGILPIVAATALTAITTSVPAGLLIDKGMKKEYMLLLSGAMGAAGAALLVFINSVVPAIIAGVLVGGCIGGFLSSGWTLANIIVPRGSVARNLSMTSTATLIGAAAARLGGLGIDSLNNQGGNLGYRVMALCVAIAFVLATITLYNLAKNSNNRPTASKSINQTITL